MGKSYRDIVRSSSIMGGAQAINYVVGLLRVKVVAILLGPAGVGLVGLYSSATSLLGTMTGLGLQGSAVRAIAHAQGRDDPLAMARTIRMMRRLVWATGILGWLATIVLALPLSRWMFESGDHAWALALLGGGLFMNTITNGQLGLLQGLRRIGDIARVQVMGALLNTVVTIGLYAWLGERGIVPVLLANSAISLFASWWFARRVQVPDVVMDWSQAVAEAKPLVNLGVAMMWSGMLNLLLDLFARSLISRHAGLDAAGMYQAAWALSGMFAGFVLGAMGTDFYPRLTEAIHDREASARAVNEQTEIGVLLALPSLLVTLGFAKWIVWLLYSAKFGPATEALVWMMLGVYCRVVSWPMAYIQLALGAGRWYMATEAIFFAIQLALVSVLVPRLGVQGAAYAFAGCCALQVVGMTWVSHRLIGFRWSAPAIRVLSASAVFVGLEFSINRVFDGIVASAFAAPVALAGILWSLRNLASRLGTQHRLVHLMLRVPGLRLVIGD